MSQWYDAMRHDDVFPYGNFFNTLTRCPPGSSDGGFAGGRGWQGRRVTCPSGSLSLFSVYVSPCPVSLRRLNRHARPLTHAPQRRLLPGRRLRQDDSLPLPDGLVRPARWRDARAGTAGAYALQPTGPARVGELTRARHPPPFSRRAGSWTRGRWSTHTTGTTPATPASAPTCERPRPAAEGARGRGVRGRARRTGRRGELLASSERPRLPRPPPLPSRRPRWRNYTNEISSIPLVRPLGRSGWIDCSVELCRGIVPVTSPRPSWRIVATNSGAGTAGAPRPAWGHGPRRAALLMTRPTPPPCPCADPPLAVVLV
jgi:hypothetical protein